MMHANGKVPCFPYNSRNMKEYHISTPDTITFTDLKAINIDTPSVSIFEDITIFRRSQLFKPLSKMTNLYPKTRRCCCCIEDLVLPFPRKIPKKIKKTQQLTFMSIRHVFFFTDN